MMNPNVLIEKIKGLPPQQQSEVEDFVEFLSQKPDRGLAKMAMRSSEKSFAKVWDNEEDSVYDEL